MQSGRRGDHAEAANRANLFLRQRTAAKNGEKHVTTIYLNINVICNNVKGTDS